MTFLWLELTAEETATIASMRGQLRTAGYPKTYPVDRATFEIIENYYKRVQASEIARWRAAGEPEDWPNPLWMTWTKTGRGLQFKGCELVEQEGT